MPGECHNRRVLTQPARIAKAVPIATQTPLHLTISEKLREQILAGHYAPREQLPSEHQLMEQFNVSRITVRRAIANLANQGLVVAQRGKGVFVKAQQKVVYRLSNPLAFLEEDLARQGVTSSIQNLVFEPTLAPAEVQQILQLAGDRAEVYWQTKLLLIDSVPAAVDISYILPELGQKFAEDLQRQMTFPVLEQNGVTIERLEVTLECTHASHDFSLHLNVPLGSPLLVYRYVAYTVDNRPIVYGYSPSRGDRLQYSVVLMRTGLEQSAGKGAQIRLEG